jgi:hypothetical protein
MCLEELAFPSTGFHIDNPVGLPACLFFLLAIPCHLRSNYRGTRTFRGDRGCLSRHFRQAGLLSDGTSLPAAGVSMYFLFCPTLPLPVPSLLSCCEKEAYSFLQQIPRIPIIRASEQAGSLTLFQVDGSLLVQGREIEKLVLMYLENHSWGRITFRSRIKTHSTYSNLTVKRPLTKSLADEPEPPSNAKRAPWRRLLDMMKRTPSLPALPVEPERC